MNRRSWFEVEEVSPGNFIRKRGGRCGWYAIDFRFKPDGCDIIKTIVQMLCEMWHLW